MHNFNNILKRKDNNSKKWNKEYIEKRFGKVPEEYYPLFIADMDYKLPEYIIEKFIEIISLGDFGYFDVKRDFFLEIIKWYKKRQDLKIEEEEIIPITGALTAMNEIINRVVKENEGVLIFPPVYGPFKDIINNNKFKLIKEPLKFIDGRYYIDFNEVKNRIDKENIKCILLCNPHNPSGRVWNEEELNELVKIAKENNVTIISDEVHSDLILNNKKFISLYNYKNCLDNIIIISSPNKTFNIAGLNIGYSIIPNKDLREKIKNALEEKKLHVNRIGVEFATICYKYGEDWVNDLVKEIEKNIEIVCNILKDSQCEIMEADAGYLLWIKFNKIEDSHKFSIDLARETGVLLESGNRFIDNYNGYLRINVATNSENLIKGIRRLKNYYDEI